MQPAKQDVDEYIAAAPKPARPMLRELRRIVKACAPKATEKLSYRMPYYHYHGRWVYFAAFSKHVSLYVMGRAKRVFAEELEPYQTSASTLQFPFGTKLPARLISRIVRDRVDENEPEKRPKRTRAKATPPRG